AHQSRAHRVGENPAPDAGRSDDRSMMMKAWRQEVKKATAMKQKPHNLSSDCLTGCGLSPLAFDIFRGDGNE
ncbi:MAG TPA: hypothetical protein VGC89_16000, partial [Pyrinomonadaceae bacterium]